MVDHRPHEADPDPTPDPTPTPDPEPPPKDNDPNPGPLITPPPTGRRLLRLPSDGGAAHLFEGGYQGQPLLRHG